MMLSRASVPFGFFSLVEVLLREMINVGRGWCSCAREELVGRGKMSGAGSWYTSTIGYSLSRELRESS